MDSAETPTTLEGLYYQVQAAFQTETPSNNRQFMLLAYTIGRHVGLIPYEVDLFAGEFFDGCDTIRQIQKKDEFKTPIQDLPIHAANFDERLREANKTIAAAFARDLGGNVESYTEWLSQLYIFIMEVARNFMAFNPPSEEILAHLLTPLIAARFQLPQNAVDAFNGYNQ